MMIKQLACVVLAAATGCAAVDEGAVDPVATPPADKTGTPGVTSGTWQALPSTPISQAGFMQLLTDGTVIVSEIETSTWWKLTPDINGSYLNGTWSQIAQMPSGYAPLYFGSGVLPDGRVMIEGGEYNGPGGGVWTTLGAVYDPVANVWNRVAPPTGWSSIGDASASVLPNGTYLQSDCCTTNAALLDATTMAWTPTGLGKQGQSNDEESWTMLWDGTILTVDCNNTVNLLASEIYNPATGMWTLGPNTANKTCDINPDGGGSHENGPAVLRYDGTVFAIGGTGHNDVYDTHTKTWSAVADSPTVAGGQLDSADGPAVLLPNGNVLFLMSPGVFNSDTHFFEWDGAAMTEVAAPPNAPNNSSYNQNFMLLPTGEVLLTDFTGDVEMYTPGVRTPVATATPVIMSIPKLVTAGGSQPLAYEPDEAFTSHEPGVQLPLATLHPGQTYKVSALRMNGLSEDVAYGDDACPATNYPILRITNQATNHVFYTRSHGHSTRAIGPDVQGATLFDIPSTVEHGLAKLELVANGIPSPALTVNIK